jgi:predicted esterase
MTDPLVRTFDHRHITVPRTARYAVMGSFDAKLSEVWIVCHGHGQLAGRFLSRFTPLEREDRLFIAPEGLSRYYLEPAAAVHGPESPVGATWMTREDRDVEIADQKRYLDLLYKEVFDRVDRAAVRFWALGFSQGVATVTRWLVGSRATITADKVVLWTGIIPPELEATGARALSARGPVTMVVGSTDEFVTPTVVAAQEAALRELGVPFRTQSFDGGHDISESALVELALTSG